jgi:hypothetical protein
MNFVRPRPWLFFVYFGGVVALFVAVRPVDALADRAGLLACFGYERLGARDALRDGRRQCPVLLRLHHLGERQAIADLLLAGHGPGVRF